MADLVIELVSVIKFSIWQFEAYFAFHKFSQGLTPLINHFHHNFAPFFVVDYLSVLKPLASFLLGFIDCVPRDQCPFSFLPLLLSIGNFSVSPLIFGVLLCVLEEYITCIPRWFEASPLLTPTYLTSSILSLSISWPFLLGWIWFFPIKLFLGLCR